MVFARDEGMILDTGIKGMGYCSKRFQKSHWDNFGLNYPVVRRERGELGVCTFPIPY